MRERFVAISGSPWPHRLAVVLACATFPLVWVGGLVTTTDAGHGRARLADTRMVTTCFSTRGKPGCSGRGICSSSTAIGLLAASVGMLTIGLLVLLLRTEDRRWMKRLGFAALGLVIFQGVLGGMRVLLDERTLAMLHGSRAVVLRPHGGAGHVHLAPLA